MLLIECDISSCIYARWVECNMCSDMRKREWKKNKKRRKKVDFILFSQLILLFSSYLHICVCVYEWALMIMIKWGKICAFHPRQNVSAQKWEMWWVFNKHFHCDTWREWTTRKSNLTLNHIFTEVNKKLCKFPPVFPSF